MKKNKIISFRLPETEFYRLQRKAKINNQSISSFCYEKIKKELAKNNDFFDFLNIIKN